MARISVQRRVNLSGPGLFVNLTTDAAELVSRSADYHQSMLLTLSELGEIVSGALLACENKDLREIQVRDLTFKVDARLERTPKGILQRLLFPFVLRQQMLVVIRSNVMQLDAVLSRATFAAALQKLSDSLTASRDEHGRGTHENRRTD